MPNSAAKTRCKCLEVTYPARWRGATDRASDLASTCGACASSGGGDAVSNLRESIETYVKRVKELAEHVCGNEQATRHSLIDPLFTMLGYDLTDETRIYNHAMLGGAMIAPLNGQLRGRACRASNSDLRVRIEQAGL